MSACHYYISAMMSAAGFSLNYLFKKGKKAQKLNRSSHSCCHCNSY